MAVYLMCICTYEIHVLGKLICFIKFSQDAALWREDIPKMSPQECIAVFMMACAAADVSWWHPVPRISALLSCRPRLLECLSRISVAVKRHHDHGPLSSWLGIGRHGTGYILAYRKQEVN